MNPDSFRIKGTTDKEIEDSINEILDRGAARCNSPSCRYHIPPGERLDYQNNGKYMPANLKETFLKEIENRKYKALHYFDSSCISHLDEHIIDEQLKQAVRTNTNDIRFSMTDKFDNLSRYWESIFDKLTINLPELVNPKLRINIFFWSINPAVDPTDSNNHEITMRFTYPICDTSEYYEDNALIVLNSNNSDTFTLYYKVNWRDKLSTEYVLHFGNEIVTKFIDETFAINC